MRAWIANASLAKKLSVAPLFAVLGFSSLALGAYLVLWSLQGDVEYLNQAFARSQQVDHLRAAMSRGQMKLYEIMAYAANSQDAGAISRRVKDLDGLLSDVEGQHRAFERTDSQAAGELDESVKSWRTSAASAAEMMASDAALGLTFMSPADDAFATLVERIDRLAARTDAARNATFESSISKISKASRSSVLVILILTATLAAATLILTAAIRGPISRLTDAMSRLAAGNHAAEIEGTERKDEIGAMARALAIFKENAARNDALEAEKRISLERERQRTAALEREIIGFEAEMGKFTELFIHSAHELSGAAESMSRASSNANDQAALASSDAMETSQQVQMMATSAEQLSAAVNEISKQMLLSSDVTSKAAESARLANDTIGGLARLAGSISEVVDLIQQIARKTNLLALNATIEAGRAGEQGKAFAIVASEVKDLANRTAAATETIGGQVTAIQKASIEAVRAIREIGTTINDVELVATTVASAVEEQHAATRTISDGVTVAAQGTDLISSRIIELATTSAQVGNASELVSSSAHHLLARAESLRAQVDQFLSAVRVA